MGEERFGRRGASGVGRGVDAGAEGGSGFGGGAPLVGAGVDTGTGCSTPTRRRGGAEGFGGSGDPAPRSWGRAVEDAVSLRRSSAWRLPRWCALCPSCIFASLKKAPPSVRLRLPSL